MDIKLLESKYVDTVLVGSLLDKRVDSEVEFLSVLSKMKEKARVDFNASQSDKDSVNSEDAVVLHAEYELLSLVESLAKHYLQENK